MAVEGSLDAGMMNDADVAVVTTVSDLQALYPTLEQAMEGGLNVVSTCEELAYPWDADPELAGRIDDLAKANRVSVLGTGVNPGFLMDFLPVAMTAVCRNVESIQIERIQDASPASPLLPSENWRGDSPSRRFRNVSEAAGSDTWD